MSILNQVETDVKLILSVHIFHLRCVEYLFAIKYIHFQICTWTFSICFLLLYKTWNAKFELTGKKNNATYNESNYSVQ